jgi:hypothetical protein
MVDYIDDLPFLKPQNFFKGILSTYKGTFKEMPCVKGSCALLNFKFMVLNVIVLLSGTRSYAIN